MLVPVIPKDLRAATFEAVFAPRTYEFLGYQPRPRSTPPGALPAPFTPAQSIFTVFETVTWSMSVVRIVALIVQVPGIGRVRPSDVQ